MKEKLELEPIRQPIAQASQISVCAHYIESESIDKEIGGNNVFQQLELLRGHDVIPRKNWFYTQGCIAVSYQEIYAIARRVQSNPYVLRLLCHDLFKALNFSPEKELDTVPQIGGSDKNIDNALNHLGAKELGPIIKVITAVSVLAARYEAHIRAGSLHGYSTKASHLDTKQRLLERAFAIGLSWTHGIGGVDGMIKNLNTVASGIVKPMERMALIEGEDARMWFVATIVVDAFRGISKKRKNEIIEDMIRRCRMATEFRSERMTKDIIGTGKGWIRKLNKT